MERAEWRTEASASPEDDAAALRAALVAFIDAFDRLKSDETDGVRAVVAQADAAATLSQFFERNAAARVLALDDQAWAIAEPAAERTAQAGRKGAGLLSRLRLSPSKRNATTGTAPALRTVLDECADLLLLLDDHKMEIAPLSRSIEDSLAPRYQEHRADADALGESRWLSARLGAKRLELESAVAADSVGPDNARLTKNRTDLAAAQAEELALIRRVDRLRALLSAVETLVRRLNRHAAAIDTLVAKLRTSVEAGVLVYVAFAERPFADEGHCGYFGEMLALEQKGLLLFDDIDRRRRQADSAFAAAFGGSGHGAATPEDAHSS